MPEPVVRPAVQTLEPWLRWRVAALRRSTCRRCFPPTLEVVGLDGTPGRPAPWSWSGPAPLDHALRVEVLLRLCPPGEPLAVVWVRPGAPEASDEDWGWAGAAAVAAGVHGADVRAVVALSRWGWLDLLSGRGRSWSRLRI